MFCLFKLRLLYRLPITNNLMDLSFNVMFNDEHIEQKPNLQQDEKKIDIVPQTCCIKIEVETKTYSDDGNLQIKEEVDCAEMSVNDIPKSLPKLENIDSDNLPQICSCKIESSVEHLFDGGDIYSEKEHDGGQISVNNIPGVYKESAIEMKQLKEEENTTDCSDIDAMHFQTSSLNEKSQCELSGAEFNQARSLMVHMSVYHRLDQQTLSTQDSSVIEKTEFDGDFHPEKEGDCLQMPENEVNIFYDGNVNQLKQNKVENTTDCSDTDAVNSQISSLNGKSRCELCGAEFNQARSLMVHRSVYHGQDLQTLPTQDSRFIETEELSINKTNKNSYKCSICKNWFSHLVILKTLQGINTDLYKCIECKIDLSSKFEEHQSIHANDEPKMFTQFISARNNFSDLQVHQHIKKREKPYKCTQCKKTFTQIYMLKNHKCVHTYHTSDKLYINTDSSMVIRESSGLKSQQSIKAGKNHYKCNLCGKAFRRSFTLKRHQHIHTGEKHKCNDCGRAFSYLSHLKIHLRIHTGDKSYKCTDCEEAFRSSNDLRRHKSVHKVVKIYQHKPHKCKLCDKAFSHLSSLQNHQYIHTGVKPHKCTDCSKAFSTAVALTNHLRIHTGETQYKCTDCSKTFFSSDGFKRHKRKHTYGKPYKCTDCGKAFRASSSLNIHLRKHTGEKPYKCTHCDMAFSRLDLLKMHENKHTVHGGKGYQCKDCSKYFLTLSDLEKHNCKEKPYKCTDCSKAFDSSYKLKNHARKHTGDKPYKCPDCSKAFDSSYMLKNHARKHTGEKPYKCTNCGQAFTWHSGLKFHQKRSCCE